MAKATDDEVMDAINAAHESVERMAWVKVTGLGEQTWKTTWDGTRQFVAIRDHAKGRVKLHEVYGEFTRQFVGHYPGIDIAMAQAAGSVRASEGEM